MVLLHIGEDDEHKTTGPFRSSRKSCRAMAREPQQQLTRLGNSFPTTDIDCSDDTPGEVEIAPLPPATPCWIEAVRPLRYCKNASLMPRWRVPTALATGL
jgi:hypothetical protein